MSYTVKELEAQVYRLYTSKPNGRFTAEYLQSQEVFDRKDPVTSIRDIVRLGVDNELEGLARVYSEITFHFPEKTDIKVLEDAISQAKTYWEKFKRGEKPSSSSL